MKSLKITWVIAPLFVPFLLLAGCNRGELDAPVAGKVTVTFEVEEMEWVDAGFLTKQWTPPLNHPVEEDYDEPDADDIDPYSYGLGRGWKSVTSANFSVPDFRAAPPYKEGDMRLVQEGSTITIQPGGQIRKLKILVSSNGSQMTGSCETNNSILRVTELKGKQQRYSRKAGGVSKVSTSETIEFSKVTKVRIPANSKSPVIKFETSWGEESEHSLKKSGKHGKYLRVIDAEKVGDEMVYSIEVDSPKHLAKSQ